MRPPCRFVHIFIMGGQVTFAVAVQQFFQPVRGQSLAIQLLTRALSQQCLAPAYWFQGPAGVGKALTARCFLQAVLGSADSHPDLLWVQPQETGRFQPPQIRIEQVRDISAFVSRTPWQSDHSWVVIEAAQSLTEAAQDALLKTLEEPGHSHLLLLVDRPDALLATIRSRCQIIPFYRLPTADVLAILAEKGYGEIQQQPELLALAQGSPGAAIQHWQQWQALPPEVRSRLADKPQSLAQALEWARRLTQTLEPATQLWLTDYWQMAYWRRYRQPELVQLWEQARQALLSHVQPQLVWEVTWMRLYQHQATGPQGDTIKG
ncbi:MAG: hypothetical protein Q6L54_00960 [Gloeomargarita sp. HHBFW_bins_205]